MCEIILLVLAGLYIYVAIAIAKAEIDAGANNVVMFSKAVSWPLTIWHTIKKLYLTRPPLS